MRLHIWEYYTIAHQAARRARLLLTDGELHQLASEWDFADAMAAQAPTSGDNPSDSDRKRHARERARREMEARGRQRYDDHRRARAGAKR
jgi:hypothetical protein